MNPSLPSNVFIADTDTVLGIFTDFRDHPSIEGIYVLKSRDKSKPLALYAASIEQLKGSFVIDKDVAAFVAAHTPSPFTFLIKSEPKTPVSHHLIHDNTIAVRIPNNQYLLSLIQGNGMYCGTSANLSGEAPFTDPYHASKALKMKYMQSPIQERAWGVESTIVDTKTWHIVRRGAACSFIEPTVLHMQTKQ